MFHLYLFLLVIFISCYSVAPGVWVGISREVCYGKDFTIPLREVGIPEMSFVPRNLFFSPAKGGKKIQVMENGTTLDPHYENSSHQFIVREATERDAGDFSFMLCDLSFGALRLTISDCSSTKWAEYGTDSSFEVPRDAYSLLYTPLGRDDGANASSSVLLWNRTGNPQTSEAGGGRGGGRGGGGGGGRGRLAGSRWKTEKVTQEDSGYYTFRDKDHKFISRLEMTVEEQRWNWQRVEGEDVSGVISLGVDSALFDLTFTPTDSVYPVVLMKAGKMQMDAIEWTRFAGRIKKTDGPPLQIGIEDLQPSDSGRFKLTDQRGNLALRVNLEVEKRDPPYGLYVGIPVGILLVVVLAVVSWCCVKRCCKKTTSKTVDTPAVYYHDDTTQPSTSAHPNSSHGPTYPAQPLVEASAASHEPAPTAPLGFDALSNDAGPQFDPSAPPLSSPPPYNGVYTSDKSNFL